MTKDIAASKEYIKDPVFVTKFISSSDEYIKDETDRLDSFAIQPDKANDIDPSDYYTAPKPVLTPSLSHSSRFSPPNKIYFGFKPVTTRYEPEIEKSCCFEYVINTVIYFVFL